MRLRFLTSEVWQGVRRNTSMIASVVLVSMVSLFFVGSGLLAQRQVDQAKGDWYEKVHAFVFLCTDSDTNVASCAGGEASTDQTEAVKSNLDNLRPLVTKVDYKTSEQAIAMFREQYKDSPYVSSVDAKSMPAFYEVRLSDPQRFDEIASGFQGMPGVAHVSNLHQVLAPFFSFLNMLGVGSAIIAGLMVVCSILLMVTTIRQVAFTRRRQVGIMRLVGASSATIYLPFVAEVLIASLAGAVLASGLLWAMVHFGVSGLASSGGGFVNLIGDSDVLVVVPWLFLGAFVLAVSTSWVTLRRYLKV
ncbi:permease-like cell division protein FtsX [Dermacoccus sp. 147Ba]|uniref:permease-like cell division protein FtsX n=1 Tax=unclassified Dermacoccus TaxID=2643059 RepID=UPI00101D1682|nr:permease-like cell division protein FtsX [Dermacoccus sp. 147Ba]MBZ4498138.1 permease-like cell division protein FtsX [Dermacoccus sp. Tok2021]RYI22632.1 FtsX-like permease family protein [Dermacoccus sp. 147Ba]